MKRLGLLAVVVCSLFLAVAAFADTYVRGYTRKDGTYVAPHYRTSPNSTRNDNYSTRGNVNPYTGQPGYKPRDSYGYGSSYDSSSSNGSSGGDTYNYRGNGLVIPDSN